MNAQVSQIGAQISVTAGSIAPQLCAAGGSTISGAGVDRRGFMSCVIRGETGALVGGPTTTSVTLQLQDSADNSSFANYVPPLGKASAITPLTGANQQGALAVNLEGARQYVRIQSVSSFTGGASPQANLCGQLVLGGAVVKPTSL